jgi:hypothetical protein
VKSPYQLSTSIEKCWENAPGKTIRLQQNGDWLQAWINPRSINSGVGIGHLLIGTLPVMDWNDINQGELEVVGERPGAKPKFSIATIYKGSQVNPFFHLKYYKVESLAHMIMLLKGYHFIIPNDQPVTNRNCMQPRNGVPQ